MKYLLKYRFVLLLSLFAVIFYGHVFVNRAYVEIQINTPQQTYFKIYWAAAGKGYSEKNMALVRIKPGKEKYGFFLTDLRRVDTLRIDPSENRGKITLKEITIRQQGLPTIQLSGARGFARLGVLGGVQSTEFTKSGWVVHSADNDPRFRLQLDLPARSLNWPLEIVRFLLLLSPLLVLSRVLPSLWPNYNYITCFAVFVLGIILTMAAVTKIDHHPDERVHIAAAQYYETHWLPPAVESPEIRDSYSDFGISRLNGMDVSYFFAGKFSKIFELFHLNSSVTFRLFNVALFAVLIILAAGNVTFRLFFVPMVLSPQIWYIFSYMNSDAFSLFVVMLSGWQLVNKESLFNHFIEQKKISLLQMLGLGLLVALLILVKKNYYFFTLFLIFCFIWRCYFYPLADLKAALLRLLIIGCIGFALVGVRIGADLSVNGFDKGEKIRTMQELTAKPMFKPSTPLNKKYNYILLRDKGVPYFDFLSWSRWGEKSYRSGFGAYGYMTVVANDMYYNIVRVFGLACLLFMGISIAVRGGRSGNILFAGAVLVSLALIFTASYYAWTVDFQAQGRYFFPIAAIAGMVLVKTEHVYNQTILRTLTCSMFILSVYSFVFVGLYGLAKYGWG